MEDYSESSDLKMNSETSTTGQEEPSADPEATGAIPKRVPEGSDSAARRREAKFRRKDQKYLPNILKTIDPNQTPASFEALKAKYSLLYEEQRKSVANYDALEKYCANLKKENDHSQVELTKSIMTSARLENLCRELQKQNKLIKEDNIAKIKEEEERRKEISTKFSDKLVDINTMMEDSKDKSEKLRQENLQMTKQFTELYNQVQEREQDIYKVTQQLKLEREYNAATIRQIELQLQAERTFYEQENKELKENLGKSEKNCEALLETIKELNGHIEVYKKQYQDFENTMCKSNSVFDNLKKQLGKMNQQIFKLEKEIVMWKTKYQQSVASMLQMTEERQKQQLDMVVMTKKIDQLTKLSRQLQADRTAYLKLLKDNNINTDDIPKHVELFQPAATVKESLLGHLKTELRSLTDELQRVQLQQSEDEQAQGPIPARTNMNNDFDCDGNVVNSVDAVERNGANPVSPIVSVSLEAENSLVNDMSEANGCEDFQGRMDVPSNPQSTRKNDAANLRDDVTLSSGPLPDIDDSSVSELEGFVQNHEFCVEPLANSTPVPEFSQGESDASCSGSGEGSSTFECSSITFSKPAPPNETTNHLTDDPKTPPNSSA